MRRLLLIFDSILIGFYRVQYKHNMDGVEFQFVKIAGFVSEKIKTIVPPLVYVFKKSLLFIVLQALGETIDDV